MQALSVARLWLVRHGQTDWNAAGRIQGHTPTNLNDMGRSQSLALGKLLAHHAFAAVWTSDLPRAVQTAELLVQGAGFALPVHPTPQLRERSFGPYEGATSQEIHAARTALGLPQTGDLADWTGMPGIESNATLWTRIAASLRELSTQYAGKDVLVITHGGVISCAIYQILGIVPGTPRRFPLSNGIMAVVQYRTDAWHLLTLLDLPMIMEPQAEKTQTDTSRVPTEQR